MPILAVCTPAWPQGALGSISARWDHVGATDGTSETATSLKHQCPLCTTGCLFKNKKEFMPQDYRSITGQWPALESWTILSPLLILLDAARSSLLHHPCCWPAAFSSQKIPSARPQQWFLLKLHQIQVGCLVWLYTDISRSKTHDHAWERYLLGAGDLKSRRKENVESHSHPPIISLSLFSAFL